MPVAAGIVGDVDMRAVLAARDMAAEGRRAAALDRRLTGDSMAWTPEIENSKK
jgi:hypothetical protein